MTVGQNNPEIYCASLQVKNLNFSNSSEKVQDSYLEHFLEETAKLKKLSEIKVPL